MGNCCSSNGWAGIKRGCAQCLCGRCKSFNRNESFGRSFGSNKENIIALGLSTAVDEVDSASSGALKVNSLDFCFEINGREHYTNRYDAMHRDSIPGGNSNLVVRRGQSFRLMVILNRPYDPTSDSISFIFTLQDEEKPNHGHGTLIGTTLNENTSSLGSSYEWATTIDSKHGNSLDIIVKSAANAPIGEWSFDIDTQLINGGGAYTFKTPTTFYLIFNPWCHDDLVYMGNKEERDEYVLTDSTLIYRGSYNRIKPSIWELGQFERNVLECSLLLLSTVAKIPPGFRGDPVRVSRALSALVNSPDDDGAIMGNWSEDFSGGTAPTKWVGSVEILQQYYRKRKPVKYGQCWVFAGTLTTIARALGIPSRIITTYCCAHDTQASLTVDYFVDETGKTLENLNSDSIWNYHTWNEVYMERADLTLSGSFYSGWQAVDATPQEMSDGVFRCGPAPVRAVKFGEILRPYDCNFLFAEVNADKLFWLYTGPSQPLKLLRRDTLGIGQLISTKAIGLWEREDITHTYKFPEQSRDERDTMLKALKQANSAFSRFYLNEEFNEINFSFSLLDDIQIGDTFFVILQIKNRSHDTPYQVSGSLNVDAIAYTGRNRDAVKSIDFDQNVPPESVESIEMEVTFKEYYKKLLDQAAFNISCMAKVHETDYDYFAQDDFRVRKPDIKIKFQDPPEVDQKTDVIIRLRNPLPIPLKNGIFHIKGTGIREQLQFKIPEVPIDGTGSATFKYVPPYSGRGTLAAKFFSKELNDVDGFLSFQIEPRPSDVYMNGHTRPRDYIVRTNVIP